MPYEYDEDELHAEFEKQRELLRGLIHSSKHLSDSIEELDEELAKLQEGA